MRIGFGSDIHKLVAERPLVLGGITIDYQLGEQAHSDGDVVFHALMDAILGALALGDIGLYFPDNDEKYRNINSSLLLKEVVKMMKEQNYQINNVDISITLEKPKLRPYIDAMRSNIAKLLETDIKNVSVKAGTNEGLDALGQGLAVKAEAIVLLK